MAHDRPKEISQRLHDVRRRATERIMELQGINVPKFRKLEEEVGAEHRELAVALWERRGHAIERTAKERAELLQWTRRSLRDDAQRHQELLSSEELHRRVIGLPCFPMQMAEFVGYGNPAMGDPVAGSGDIDEDGCEATVNYDGTLPLAKPRARAEAWFTDTSHEVTAHARLKFKANVASDGYYCVNPLVTICGAEAALSFSMTGCTGGSTEGEVVLSRRIELHVHQINTPWIKRTHHLPEIKTTGRDDVDRTFYYNSKLHGGVGAHATWLVAGDQVDIFVDFVAEVTATNYGFGWVDTQIEEVGANGDLGTGFMVSDVEMSSCPWGKRLWMEVHDLMPKIAEAVEMSAGISAEVPPQQ